MLHAARQLPAWLIFDVSQEDMRFSLNITAEFLRRSHARRTFRNWWRLLVAAVLILVAIAADMRSGEFGRMSVLGVSALGFAILIYALAWLRQSRGIDAWIKRQGAAPVVYTLSDEAVEAVSQSGSTNLKWDAFSSLHVSDLDVLLYVDRGSALTLPTHQVPSDALELLKQRFSAHGKKVEDEREPG